MGMMVQVRAQRSLSPAEHAKVAAFLGAAYDAGAARLNDHLTTDLTNGERDGFRVAIASDGDDVVGYAQASAANDGVVVGVVVHPGSHVEPGMLLAALLSIVPAKTAVTWWSTEDAADVAAGLGLSPDRRLLHMVRSLPIHYVTDVALRAFRVGIDEAEWLEVNNAAFAAHGEQGGWDLAVLEQREREPWFDATGFLLHERGGRLAAFCWTKLHPGSVLVGEIYVIAVHPDFHGHGLGRALTIAGLQHLQSVGARTAMLYVDAANLAAVGLYRALDFSVEHTEVSYRRSPASPITEEDPPQ